MEPYPTLEEVAARFTLTIIDYEPPVVTIGEPTVASRLAALGSARASYLRREVPTPPDCAQATQYSGADDMPGPREECVNLECPLFKRPDALCAWMVRYSEHSAACIICGEPYLPTQDWLHVPGYREADGVWAHLACLTRWLAEHPETPDEFRAELARRIDEKGSRPV